LPLSQLLPCIYFCSRFLHPPKRDPDNTEFTEIDLNGDFKRILEGFGSIKDHIQLSTFIDLSSHLVPGS
jgi:hypothetical protein